MARKYEIFYYYTDKREAKAMELSIYERIDLKLKEMNVSRKKMCLDLGIPYSTLTSFYQNHSGNITLSTIKKIANYLNCSIDYLVSGESLNACQISGKNANITTVINENFNLNKELSEIEFEIVKICSRLSTKKKNMLLSTAYKLEQE